MQPATLRPTAIRIDKPRKLLVIPWNDGVTSEYNWQALRDACPCAGCRTPEAAPVPAPLQLVFKLKPAKVALLDGAEVVGNYAVRRTRLPLAKPQRCWAAMARRKSAPPNLRNWLAPLPMKC